jgi:hypothetical protein
LMHIDRGASGTGRPRAEPCPDGHPQHALLHVGDDVLDQLRLPRASPLHVDRARQPRDGDLVWVELVRPGSAERLVRRFGRYDGWITLEAVDARRPAILRQSLEVFVLGVIDAWLPVAGRGRSS